MRSPNPSIGWCGSALLLLYAFCAGCSHPRTPPSQPPLTLKSVLSAEERAGYRVADRPGSIRLPADQGAHPEYRSEWWYLTGNLADKSGNRYGYQFTIFRLATSPAPPDGDSAWRSNQVYLAHAALTDPSRGNFLEDQRASRAALGLAGARSNPFAVWVENWRLSGAACPDCAAFDLDLRAAPFRLSLQLRSTKPVVLHGDRGLSRKNRAGTSASYYYSSTRIRSEGTLERGGDEIAVAGESWFDHEWSTSALTPEQGGWDWFSLQLSDHSELMLFQIRDQRDPALDFRAGTLVRPDGSAQNLREEEIEVRVTQRWRSDRTGVTYPAGWNLALPALDARFRVAPLMADQEIDLALRYWEGAVTVTGAVQGRSVSGRGYAELTGYGASPGGPGNTGDE